MSTPDLSSPAAVAAFLRQYNTWRRDESELDAPDRPKMPDPSDLGRAIDAAVRMLEGIAHAPIPTQPGDCEAAAFRTEDLRARVAELEASLSRADTRAMNAIADAEKRAYWFASMALRGEELKFSPDDVVRLDKLIMGLMFKAPPLYELIDTAVVVLCKAGKRLKELEPRVVELEALCSDIYQVAGALGAPAVVLDALHAAASGDPLPRVSLIGLDIANEIERAEREPVAQAEGYVTALRYIAWEAAGYMDCVRAAKRAIGETGALPPPPKTQPTKNED